MVLIQAGWDDVVRFTALDAVRATYSRVLHAASRKAPVVILAGGINTGLSPAFSVHVSRLFSARAWSVREIFLVLSRETDVEYVDLYRERAHEPMLRDRGRFFCRDRIHPTGEGYGLMYEEIRSRSTLSDVLGSG